MPARIAGRGMYKEYCAQCHGFTGKGDGPAASGLEPKPAIHANIPFEKLPIDYLYNVINHGGRGDGEVPEYAVLELDDWSAGRGRCDGLLESDL